MDDLVGLCSLCGKPGAMHTCHVCGQLVCAQCYNRDHGVCIQCQFGLKQ